MPISDLFNNEFNQRNRGHFSAIVRVALADGKVSPEEQAFLDKLAVHLEISEPEYADILENPLKYPINPPYLHTQRLERTNIKPNSIRFSAFVNFYKNKKASK